MRSKMHSWKKMSKILVALGLVVLFAGCELFNPTPKVPATSVSISASTEKLSAGSTLELSAEVGPADASNKKVTWTSSDETVATVSASGVVTPVGFGVVTITATSSSDSDVSDSRVVRVGYTETFTNPGNWTQLEDGDRKYETQNGEYSMEYFKRGIIGRVFARLPTTFDGSSFVRLDAPYELSVDVAVNAADEGPNEISTGGVVFNYEDYGTEDYRYDLVRIASNGQFVVEHLDSVDGWTTYQGFTNSTSIKTDGTFNRLVVLQGASSFSISVNGVELGEYTNAAAPVGPVYMGLSVSESSEDSTDPVTGHAVFDNFEIYPTAN